MDLMMIRALSTRILLIAILIVNLSTLLSQKCFAAPTLTTPTTENLGANLATLVLQSSETGTGYFTLLLGSNADCGTGAQIAEGQDSTGAIAPYHGSLPLTATTANNYTVRNLTESTSYTVCFTADSSNGLNSTPVQINLATIAAMSISTPDWSAVGSAGFSAGYAAFTSLAFAPDGTPYVAYEDNSNESKVTVMKFSGGVWNLVGNAGFSAGSSEFVSLDFAPDGTPYVAYRDGGNGYKATVMKYSGGVWNLVGNAGFSAGDHYYTSLAFAPDGTPYVAYGDLVNGNKATVMHYSGGTWNVVGSVGFTSGQSMDISLAFSSDGSPYVAYADAGNSNKTTVMNYSGGVWSVVGISGFSAGSAGNTSLRFAPDGTPYVVYSDAGSGSKATVMKYSGGVWNVVGNSGFSSGWANDTALAFAPDGTLFVAYSDNNIKATVMKYSEGVWSEVGSAGFSAGSANYISLSFAPNGLPYVAYGDYGNSGKMVVMTLSTFYGLSVSVTGSGTVHSAPTPDINCSGNCAKSYTTGTVVTLTATPGDGYGFGSWSGCDSVNGSMCTVTMDNAKSATATFTINNYSVTPSVGTNGSLSPNTVQTVPYGTRAAFVITPDIGYKISTVTGCGGSISGDVYTAIVNSDCTVSATFSTLAAINGVCGSSNSQSMLSAPTAYLCAIGNSSEITGTGPWNWSCAGVSGGTTANCSATNLNYGLVASYPFNGNANDESGNGNNGTVNGATLTLDRFGHADSAYNFNGTNNYISIPDSQSLKPTNISISAWVKPSSLNGYMAIVSKWYGGDGYYLRTDYTGNLVAFSASGDSNASGTELTSGIWTNVTATFDGTSQRIYLNGVLKHEIGGAGYPNSISNVGNPLAIGSWSGGSVQFFNGAIDDVRIYNRGLSQTEVTSLFQGSSTASTYPLSLTISGAGNGAVHSNPTPDISCLSGACSQNYAQGTVVTLNAPPATGSTFSGWSGACSGAGICSVTMDSAKSVIAIFSRSGDTTPPTITAFTMPTTSITLDVEVSTFTATDNVGVTGYMITQDATPPAMSAAGWNTTAPASYTFLTPGNCFAYAWAKDAAGNVSSAGVTVVNITIASVSDTLAPLITSFLVPAANTLTPAISAFAVIDNVGVIGYLVSENSMTPLVNDSSWSSNAPIIYNFTSYGAKALYAWVKDAAGNISGRVTAYTILLDPTQAIDTLLTGWPGNPATTSPSTFTFTANQPGATFDCSMDGQSWFACISPASFGALANGGHMFSVRAKNSGEVYDATPVTYIWTVSVPLVLINLSHYTGLLQAYLSSGNDQILQIKGMEFTDVPIFDRPVNITLKGGHDGNFNSTSGNSVFHGKIEVSAGTVAFDGITIQ